MRKTSIVNFYHNINSITVILDSIFVLCGISAPTMHSTSLLLEITTIDVFSYSSSGAVRWQYSCTSYPCRSTLLLQYKTLLLWKLFYYAGPRLGVTPIQIHPDCRQHGSAPRSPTPPPLHLLCSSSSMLINPILHAVRRDGLQFVEFLSLCVLFRSFP